MTVAGMPPGDVLPLEFPSIKMHFYHPLALFLVPLSFSEPLLKILTRGVEWMAEGGDNRPFML